jgi:hypothetical protein
VNKPLNLVGENKETTIIHYMKGGGKEGVMIVS